jgi:MFS family permease
MSGALAARGGAFADRGERVRDAALLVVLFLLAALVSGFTIRRYLDPFDEGLLLSAAQRIARGEWPYADFGWPYGPGHPLLMWLADRLLGPSVLWWRIVRTAADAAISVLAFALVRRQAGTGPALAAWLAAAVTMAQPTVANPFPVAFALGLGALLAAAGLRTTLAGVLVALSIAWRPDFGLAALAAVAAGLVVAGEGRRALQAALVAVAGALVAFVPFLVAAGPRSLWEHLFGITLREGSAWRLPFPLLYDGRLRLSSAHLLLQDGKDLIGYELPLVSLVLLILAAAALAWRRGPRAARLVPAGVAVLGAFGALYLRSRADEFHVQPLAVCAAILAALAIVRTGGALRVLLAAGLAFVALAGLANRVSALVLPPDLRAVHLHGVPGIRVPPGEATALPRVVAAVDRLVPPGRPVFVAPRRSDRVAFTDPLLYVLVDRPSILRDDASLEAQPAEQARIVGVLRRTRPVVIRWLDPLSSKPEPNARGRSSGSRALDRYLAGAYREHARFGDYAILVPRAA